MPKCFRGLTAAASLKRNKTKESKNDAKMFPRLNGRGLIEAVPWPRLCLALERVSAA